MEQSNREVLSKKISVRELFSSPQFYIALFPHVISLFLIFSNNLGYFYVFSIFYSELLVDNFIFNFSVIFIKKQEVQKLYNSDRSRFLLASRGFLIGLALCIFLGIFSFIILARKGGSIKDVVTNNAVLWAIGIYTATKLINLIINIYRYKTGKRLNVEDGKTFIINLFTLLLFIMPGIFILAFLGAFIDNIETIAVILLFVLRAYIDSASVVVQMDSVKATP